MIHWSTTHHCFTNLSSQKKRSFHTGKWWCPWDGTLNNQTHIQLISRGSQSPFKGLQQNNAPVKQLGARGSSEALCVLLLELVGLCPESFLQKPRSGAPEPLPSPCPSGKKTDQISSNGLIPQWRGWWLVLKKTYPKGGKTIKWPKPTNARSLFGPFPKKK